MKKARVKQDARLSNIQAHTGLVFVKYEWRDVPNDGHTCPLLDYRETAVSQKLKEVETAVSNDPILAVDIEGLTVAVLKEMARDAGVEGFSTMRKAELISALRDD